MPVIDYSDVGHDGVNFQEFLVSGTWFHPKPGTPYRLYVELIGGGGGGGGAAGQQIDGTGGIMYGGSGGQLGGQHHVDMIATYDQPVVIGYGGSFGWGKYISGPANGGGSNGAAGGQTRFGDYVADGGAGGEKGLPASTGGSADGANAAGPAFNHHNSIALSSACSLVRYNVGVHGADNGSAYGGGAGSCYSGVGAAGGRGSTTTSGTFTGVNGEDADPANPGAGGGGGGACIARNGSPYRTFYSGNGGKGAPGRVRVWSWRIE